MPFKSIHPLNHPALASLLLINVTRNFFRVLGRTWYIFATELAAPVRYLVCQPTFQLTELILRKNIRLAYMGWIYLLLPLGEFPRRTYNLYANLGGSELSICMVHCFKTKICFPVSPYILPFPQGCLNLGGKKAYLNLSTQTKRSVFLILFKSIRLVLLGDTSIPWFLSSQSWMC